MSLKDPRCGAWAVKVPFAIGFDGSQSSMWSVINGSVLFAVLILYEEWPKLLKKLQMLSLNVMLEALKIRRSDKIQDDDLGFIWSVSKCIHNKQECLMLSPIKIPKDDLGNDNKKVKATIHIRFSIYWLKAVWSLLLNGCLYGEESDKVATRSQHLLVRCRRRDQSMESVENSGLINVWLMK